MTENSNIALIEWRSDFEIGIPSVDHEHREMIDRINALLQASGQTNDKDKILGCFADIYAWISAHFALEEKIMRNYQYGDFLMHKEDHEDLLDDLRDIMDAAEAGGLSREPKKLQETMSAWFVNHFKTHDARLHALLPTDETDP